jgi:hypothetical protein
MRADLSCNAEAAARVQHCEHGGAAAADVPGQDHRAAGGAGGQRIQHNPARSADILCRRHDPGQPT